MDFILPELLILFLHEVKLTIPGVAIRLNGTQDRLTITDSSGNYHFDNVETNGLYTVVPSRANYTFSPAQRSFSALGSPH